VAARAVLLSLGGLLGGLVGGLVTRQLHGLQANPIIWGPLLWNNWHVTFALSVLARLAALICILGMSDPGAGTFRDMARHVGANVYNTFATRVFYRLRTLGRPRRNPPGNSPE